MIHQAPLSERVAALGFSNGGEDFIQKTMYIDVKQTR